MKVLVVDDNRDLADLIQNVLEGEGMEVMSANDGRKGYTAYLLFKPDLVITDIQMPGETGLEMMGHIRDHDPLIKTIYMSGDIDAYRPLLEQEKRRYPISFVRKPFQLDLLTKLVSEPVPVRNLRMDNAAILYHKSLQQSPDGIPSSHETTRGGRMA